MCVCVLGQYFAHYDAKNMNSSVLGYFTIDPHHRSMGSGLVVMYLLNCLSSASFLWLDREGRVSENKIVAFDWYGRHSFYSYFSIIVWHALFLSAEHTYSVICLFAPNKYNFNFMHNLYDSVVFHFQGIVDGTHLQQWTKIKYAKK